MFKILKKIPILGVILYITNSYIYNGDVSSNERFAPVKLWFRKLTLKFFFCLSMTLLIFKELIHNAYIHRALDFSLLSVSTISPGDKITATFPSLIGFGIGVYALIFALDKSIVREVQKSISKSKKITGSVLMLSSDLAYPLIILVITLGIGILQTVFSQSFYLCFMSWFMLWYSFVVIIEMIGILFGLTNNSLLDKLDE
ncbi:TPA: hypothetical protein ACKQJM_000269 [Serratia marcescens]|uniref:hypothetical protein n=1 Tax=Serratia marcescens TaxID=615 RepID=UPI002178CE77|nr:hypothetical protein [Serratia marcescens]CAI1610521.1 Uncharacterised protein [Serratia marcescens]